MVHLVVSKMNKRPWSTEKEGNKKQRRAIIAGITLYQGKSLENDS